MLTQTGKFLMLLQVMGFSWLMVYLGFLMNLQLSNPTMALIFLMQIPEI